MGYRSFRFAILCAGAACIAPPLAAQGTAVLLDSIRQFERADHDGDKHLSWEEFRNYLVQQFHHLDRNGDGVIHGDEHLPAVDAQRRPAVAKDVSLDAFTSALWRVFKTADRDKSGSLSYAEWGESPKGP